MAVQMLNCGVRRNQIIPFCGTTSTNWKNVLTFFYLYMAVQMLNCGVRRNKTIPFCGTTSTNWKKDKTY
jgi:hypothetical protein